MVRWLREALVDGPARIGWQLTLTARLVGMAGAAWLLNLALEMPYRLTLMLAAAGLAATYAAGWVWQWRIRAQQRAEASR